MAVCLGKLAQWREHLPSKQAVLGSSPRFPTVIKSVTKDGRKHYAQEDQRWFCSPWTWNC